MHAFTQLGLQSKLVMFFFCFPLPLRLMLVLVAIFVFRLGVPSFSGSSSIKIGPLCTTHTSRDTLLRTPIK